MSFKEYEKLYKKSKSRHVQGKRPPRFLDESQNAPRPNEGKKHQAITYHADFTYTENGREVVEDVKGFSKENFFAQKLFG